LEYGPYGGRYCAPFVGPHHASCPVHEEKVVGFEANLQPEESGVKAVYSPGPVSEVLEFRAGWTTRNNVKIGDSVTINQ